MESASLLAFFVIILLFSVILHEVMHGLAALYFGDRTAEQAGRLTLNPIPHIDPIGTIALPALLLISQSPFLFGWAKPVPINPFNFSDIRKGELAVSLAGVGANFGLAIIAAILFHALPFSGFFANPNIFEVLSFTVTINLLLGFFNLIPLPPLDGSKVLATLLPPSMALEYQKLERFGFILILMLWFIPVGGGSLLGFILSNALNLANLIFKVPLRLF